MEGDWILLALVGMIFASFANISLKFLVKNENVLKEWSSVVIPVAVLVLAALVIAYFFFLRGVVQFKPELVLWTTALVIFSLAAFIFVTLALRTGKVALVTAVLSLSTAFVAFLSFMIFNDRFSVRELAAVALATASVLALV
ncbi:EamA family transporter, partial [Candidatus Micrarchaeota archaeon]|nr:EamA family transporter [Candidatus Micrarchaeota archaeon]